MSCVRCVRRAIRRPRWVLALGLLVATLASTASAEISLPTYKPSQFGLTSLSATAGGVPRTAMAESMTVIGAAAMRAAYPFLTGAGQAVAVIDTGVDASHPALAGRVLQGWDFVNNDAYAGDDNSHGTHVSGIIASCDATYPGVAPAAGIVPLKVMGADGRGSDSNVVAALNWVADNASRLNITAVNMSIGDGGNYTAADVNLNSPYEQALVRLKNMGVFVVAAAGNDGHTDGVSYPAASPNVVSVGGTWDSNDYSNYLVSWVESDDNDVPLRRIGEWGPHQDDIMVLSNRYYNSPTDHLNLMAPGCLINSSIPIALDTDDGEQDGWAEYLGTSMAAPHVTGASVVVRQALMKAGLLDADPAKQVDQILDILEGTGYLIGDWWFEWGFSINGADGHSRNVVQDPYDADLRAGWAVRKYSWGLYPRLDLEAAVASINPAPEPGSLLLISVGGTLLALRRRAGRPRLASPPTALCPTAP